MDRKTGERDSYSSGIDRRMEAKRHRPESGICNTYRRNIKSITRSKNVENFPECKTAAIKGGGVAGNARLDAEKKIALKDHMSVMQS